MNFLLFVVPAYVLGSIPFAVVTAKIFRLPDPREYGSKNPGATNVLRSGNKWAALLTLLGDALKGWLAMWLARALGAEEWVVASSGLAAFIGHVFPLFLRFRGGKGVATALGVLAGFSWALAGVAAAVWLTTAALFRYSSLAALAAALAAPLAAWMLCAPQTAAFVAAMSALLLWRHQGNIRRLLAGEEGRIGRSK